MDNYFALPALGRNHLPFDETALLNLCGCYGRSLKSRQMLEAHK